MNTSDHERPRVTTSENSLRDGPLENLWGGGGSKIPLPPHNFSNGPSLKYIFSVIMISLIRHFIKLRLLNRKELISGDNKNRTWNISFPFPKGRARTKWNPGVIV